MSKWTTLKGAVRDDVLARLAGLLENSEADLARAADTIANTILVVARTGRTDLVEELKENLVLIAEQNRIRGVHEFKAVVETAVGTLVGILTVAL